LGWYPASDPRLAVGGFSGRTGSRTPVKIALLYVQSEAVVNELVNISNNPLSPSSRFKSQYQVHIGGLRLLSETQKSTPCFTKRIWGYPHTKIQSQSQESHETVSPVYDEKSQLVDFSETIVSPKFYERFMGLSPQSHTNSRIETLRLNSGKS
jgi:hypothetical protein